MLKRQRLLVNLIEERRAPKNTEHLNTTYTTALAANRRGVPRDSYLHVRDVTNLIHHFRKNPTAHARALATSGGALPARRRSTQRGRSQRYTGGAARARGSGSASFSAGGSAQRGSGGASFAAL